MTTKTELEAKEVLARQASTYSPPLCPLLRDKCVPHCVCFAHARIWRRSIAPFDYSIKQWRRWIDIPDIVFEVTEPSCTNAMFTGEINAWVSQ